MENPIFILGLSRTGSKIYLKTLNNFTNINITPELNFLTFSWTRKDFTSMVLKNIGNLKKDSNIPKLIDLMYSGKIEGTFWKTIKNRNINKKNLEERIFKSDRSFRSILKILIEEHAISNNKKIPGAKFPVHFTYISKLLKCYPNCKIIFLIRDPRAIYSSLAFGFIKKGRFNYGGKIKKLLILIYTITHFIWAVKIHNKYKNLENYQLFRFEDVVSEPEKYIPKLCDFLKIDFKTEMLAPSVVDSSFHKKKKKGFDKDTLYRWKKHISPITANFIKLLTNKQMNDIGYK